MKELVIADLEELGGRGTLMDLERLRPGRYDKRYFKKAVETMWPDVKYAGRVRMFGSHMWKLKSWKDPDEEAKEDEGSEDGA